MSIPLALVSMRNTSRGPWLSMATLLFVLNLYFFVHLITSVTADYPYLPSDNILINCGFPSNTSSLDGRIWISDMLSMFTPSAKHNTSTTSEASAQGSSVTQIPYMTARIFHSQLTYSLSVSPGPKFIRLYFYPASYSGLDKSNAFFSVTVGSFTLLRNFSAFLTAEYLSQERFIKEFCVNVESQRLNITFNPTPNTYGFVNGIEVVSMPVDLYFHREDDLLVGQQSQFTIDNTSALETLYRLNVGGNDISPKEDTGMFRFWSDDTVYILPYASGVVPSNFTNKFQINYSPTVPPYTAPESLYRTARTMGIDASVNSNYNLTWSFSIDSGFYYLFRLHFCEFQYEVTDPFRRVFFIFIGNQTADAEADVIAWSGGYGIPVYKDYVVMVPDSGGKQDLWLALHPNTKGKPMYYDGILNGLEIFKLNKTNGDLAGPNPFTTGSSVGLEQPKYYPGRPSNSKKQTLVILVGSVVGGVTAVFAISLICFLFFRRRQVKNNGRGHRKSKWVQMPHNLGYTRTSDLSLPSDLCRHFSFAEIKAATKNFDDKLRIGVGGFGNVYKGYLDGGATTVAIKRCDPRSRQGAKEFHTEIDLLTQLRHLHLVSLIGYCADDREMILVYDYMANGTLRDHLYGKQKPPLSWKQRLEICIGAARGLHYLHSGAKQPIIHRDVKTTNILLDDKWVAKVSDFGLSKVGPTGVSHTHVSTEVKGSFGYLDPEYYKCQQLTEKSDVYSFGVVLFEVLSARPTLNSMMENEQACLASWARLCHQKGTLDQIIDPYLMGKIAPECLKKFAEIAKNCLADQGIERPMMGEVLWNLEFALQLQESLEEEACKGKHVADNEVLSGSSGQVSSSTNSGVSTMTTGGHCIASDTSFGVMPGEVFSEIMNTDGR